MSPDVLETFIAARNHLLTVFWFEGSDIMSLLVSWGFEAGSEITKDVVAWVFANVVGCGIVESENALDLYLAQFWPFNFQAFVEFLIPGFTVRLWVTGPLLMASGIGPLSDIQVKGMPNGRSGFFLQSVPATTSSVATRYALTCSHVLDGNPGDMVLSGGTAIGSLKYRNELKDWQLINPGGPYPVAPNQVDWALAQLDDGIQAANVLPDGSRISLSPATPAENDTIIVAQCTAVVRTLRADLKLNDGDTDFFFNDLTFAIGGQTAALQRGDSGSPTLTQDLRPVGLVIALSNGRSFDNPDVELGPGVAICDINKILTDAKTKAGTLQFL